MVRYSQLVSTEHPGLFIVLLDQSSSMSGKKAETAADAVNSVIYEIVLACQSGSTVRNRCFVGVVGYGAKIEGVLGNNISEIAENPVEVVEEYRPIWIKPVAKNTTPMAEAIEKAYELASSWVENHHKSFPPVVINITDGAPNDEPKARKAAERLIKLTTEDGNLLLFNVHISGFDGGHSNEIILPAKPGELPNKYAKFLYEISSELPDEILNKAGAMGLPSTKGTRGFVFEASADTLVKMISFGSRVSGLVLTE